MATESQRPDAETQAASQPLYESVSPMMVRSLEAFRRDLPQLLKTHYRKWVAYYGDEQLGFARTQTKLYQMCLRRGLKPDEFLVNIIEPEEDEDLTCSADW